MPPDIGLDFVQSAALITVALAVVYALYLLRHELRHAAATVHLVLTRQKEIQDAIDGLWKRVDEIEMRQGIRADVDMLARLKRISDVLDDKHSGPR